MTQFNFNFKSKSNHRSFFDIWVAKQKCTNPVTRSVYRDILNNRKKRQLLSIVAVYRYRGSSTIIDILAKM